MSLLTEMQANVRYLPLPQLAILKDTIEQIIHSQNIHKKNLSNNELRALFHSFTGSIARPIDEKHEKLNYLDERYGSID
ncbi:MAG: hypothetical protein IJ187_06505 [Neisseriaceae bacterium]|nr:hypothetical protein [Neisseriaceae bacterium]MBQ9259483.1 hypothetical protein [Neisseriaceae bacterium]MBQ9619431.1 hypothetical protein [Neisseriaceae bacterium]MBQ9725483.1 hypothetical protein [Neisseriaceae bacterium]MBR3425706.1 hypothetical protein [Neisseriaceae bacterium]